MTAYQEVIVVNSVYTTKPTSRSFNASYGMPGCGAHGEQLHVMFSPELAKGQECA